MILIERAEQGKCREKCSDFTLLIVIEVSCKMQRQGSRESSLDSREESISVLSPHVVQKKRKLHPLLSSL